MISSSSQVRRIYKLDPAGSIRQMETLGVLESAPGAAISQVGKNQGSIRLRSADELRKIPFTDDEKKVVERHIAMRVQKLVTEINKEFNRENRYLAKLRKQAGIQKDEDLLTWHLEVTKGGSSDGGGAVGGSRRWRGWVLLELAM